MKNNNLTLSQAIEGYNLAALSRPLSEHTIQDYNNTYRLLMKHFGERDPIFTSITKDDIRKFFISHANRVSNKTLYNYHTNLSALYTWAVKQEMIQTNLLHEIDRAKPEQREIYPIPEDHIRAMFSVLGKSKSYTRPGKRSCTHSTPFEERNRAILMLLLDTGMRASELCGIKIHEIDLKQQTVKVFGKGKKERIVPFSARTAQIIWRYLANDRKDDDVGKSLFSTDRGRPLSPTGLRHIIERICDRANLPKYTPHIFRHTFAINYLRNYPNTFTLQKTMGHVSPEMTKRYLFMAQNDLSEALRQASPVEKWGL